MLFNLTFTPRVGEWFQKVMAMVLCPLYGGSKSLRKKESSGLGIRQLYSWLKCLLHNWHSVATSQSVQCSQIFQELGTIRRKSGLGGRVFAYLKCELSTVSI